MVLALLVTRFPFEGLTKTELCRDTKLSFAMYEVNIVAHPSQIAQEIVGDALRLAGAVLIFYKHGSQLEHVPRVILVKRREN
jgi:hypothetical protein